MASTPAALNVRERLPVWEVLGLSDLRTPNAEIPDVLNMMFVEGSDIDGIDANVTYISSWCAHLQEASELLKLGLTMSGGRSTKSNQAKLVRIEAQCDTTVHLSTTVAPSQAALEKPASYIQVGNEQNLSVAPAVDVVAVEEGQDNNRLYPDERELKKGTGVAFGMGKVNKLPGNLRVAAKRAVSSSKRNIPYDRGRVTMLERYNALSGGDVMAESSPSEFRSQRTLHGDVVGESFERR